MAEPERGGVAGLILAGGQGSRMKGQDKGLVVLRDEPLVSHVVRRLAPQVGRLIISANRHPQVYAQYGETVADGAFELGAWQGPLAGIAAALAALSSPDGRAPEWLVVAPCDTPFLPTDMAARLIGAAHAAGAPMAYAMSHGQRHSACMALRPSLLPGLLAYLRGGDRKVGLWQAGAGAAVAVFDDAPPQAFMNVNTPEDLARAERYASQ